MIGVLNVKSLDAYRFCTLQVKDAVVQKKSFLGFQFILLQNVLKYFSIRLAHTQKVRVIILLKVVAEGLIANGGMNNIAKCLKVDVVCVTQQKYSKIQPDFF